MLRGPGLSAGESQFSVHPIGSSVVPFTNDRNSVVIRVCLLSLFVATTLVGCSTSAVQVSETNTTVESIAPTPVINVDDYLGTVVPVTDIAVDPTAGGTLVDLPIPDWLKPLARGSRPVDPFGNLWNATGVEGEESVLVVETGEVRDFGTSLIVGRAATPQGEGTTGEVVLTENGTVVWQARDEGGQLVFDSYDIFAWAPEGEPTKIGESTVDWDGMTFSAPGDGNYLTVVGERAYWVDGVARAADNQWGYQQYSSIFSAPLDGSEPQVVMFEGARFSQVDQCAPAGQSRMTYFVDPMSSGNTEQVPTLHAVNFDEDGNVESDEVIWEGPHIQGNISSVGVCGETIAIGYSLTLDETDMQRYLTVYNSRTTSSLYLTPHLSTGAGSITVVPGGVLAFEWDGIFPGNLVFWSSATDTWYNIGTGMTNGSMYGAASLDTLVMPRQLPEVEGEVWYPYEPRIVKVESS